MRHSTTVRFLIFTLALGALTALGMNKEARADFPPPTGQSELITDFTPNRHTPENVTTDFYGNVYVGLMLTGQVVKVDPTTGQWEVYVEFDLGLAYCGPADVPGVTGMWMNPLTKTLYVNLNPCDPARKGVWRVPSNGSEPVQLSTTPPGAMLNGLVKRDVMLYSVDSFSLTGAVYQTPIYGDGSEATVFLEDDLIAFDPTLPPPPGIPFMPGANGIQKFNGDLYISHSGKNIIIRVPMSGFGPWTQAGTPEVYVDALGPDDFAFDWQGNIYYTNDPYNQLVKVTPDNVATVLLDADDGLNGSTAATFGRLGDHHVLYVTSGAFPFMPPPFNNGQPPSLMAYGNDIAGYPLR